MGLAIIVSYFVDYISGRLLKNEGTKSLGKFLQECFKNVGEFPRYLVPAYFDDVLRIVYYACVQSSFSKMSKYVHLPKILYGIKVSTFNQVFNFELPK